MVATTTVLLKNTPMCSARYMLTKLGGESSFKCFCLHLWKNAYVCCLLLHCHLVTVPLQPTAVVCCNVS